MKKQGRQKTIHIILGLGIIGLLTLTTINSIYINPGDSIEYQIDSPLETYVFNEAYNLSSITIAATYIVFNNTGFNVTPANPINIRIDHIDEDILNPADGNDDLLVFTITNAPGITTFNINGFETETSYIININDVLYDTSVSTGDGSISVTDTPNISDEYSIFKSNVTTLTVITNETTNVMNNNVTFNGFLEDDNGSKCGVWFDYGVTESYGTSVPDDNGTVVNSWDISGTGTSATGITTDGNYIWIVDIGDDEVYKYTMSGTYTNEHWDTSSVGNNNPTGITTDGNYIWIVDAVDDEIYKYTMSGTYTAESLDISGVGMTSPEGITTDEEYIWVVDYDIDEVFKYTMSGTYTNEHWSTQNNPVDIATDGEYIWICTGSTDDEVYTYTMSGTYTNEHWDTGDANDVGGMVFYNARLFITDRITDRYYQYAINITGNSGYNFNYNLLGIDTGTLYHFRAVANNTEETSYGNDLAFLTLPNVTTNPQTVGGINTINISWTKGDAANTTHVERNTASSWDKGEGTLIYNDTGLYYIDQSITENITYYYQLWSFTNWTDNNITYSAFSSYNTTFGEVNILEAPTNGTSSYDTSTTELTLTWNDALYSDREVVIQNNNSIPTSYNDGWKRYNDTTETFTGVQTSIAYFSVFSYNVTYNVYSVLGLDIPWGALVINVYKENEPWIAIGNYTVFITNNDASESYESINQNNPFIIDYNDIPNGDDITIQISKEGYDARSKIVDISDNIYLNITFLLPPNSEGSPHGEEDEPWYVPPEGDDIVLKSTTETVDDHTTDETVTLECSPDSVEIVYVFNNSLYGGWIEIAGDKYSLSGDVVTVNASVLDENSTMIKVQYYCIGDESYSSHYIITVVDNAEQSVEDAFVDISRYMNTTDGYETIISSYTDSSGQVEVNLIPDIVYYVVISKTNYNTTSSFWSPPEISQYEDSQKKFILYPTESNYTDEVGYSECVLFEGGYSGHTGFVNLSNDDADSVCGLITNYSIYIYRINTTTNVTSLIYSVNGSNQSVNITFDIFDLNNTFFVSGFINHDVFGGHWNSFYINPSLADSDSPYVYTDKDEFDNFFNELFGGNSLGWSAFFGIFVLLAGLFAFGQRNIGVGIMITGVTILGFNALIGLLLLNGTLCIILIVFGILVQWKTSRKEGG